MSQKDHIEAIRQKEWVELYRKKHPTADRWAEGYGPIKHEVETQTHIFAMAQLLTLRGNFYE